ncbi:hypothetical protein ACLOJK_000303 [Asimina triloba]
MVKGDRLAIYHVNCLQWGLRGHVHACLRKMVIWATVLSCPRPEGILMCVRWNHRPRPVRTPPSARSFSASSPLVRLSPVNDCRWRLPLEIKRMRTVPSARPLCVVCLLLGDSIVDMPSTKKMMMPPLLLLPVIRSSPLGEVLKIIKYRCRRCNLEGTSVGAGRGDVDR